MNLVNHEQANGLVPNWGQTIFQSANEIAANTLFRKNIDEIQARTEAEKQWWEKRRASIQSEFMKELDEEAEAKAYKVTSPTKSTSVVSDEDAILVQGGGPTASEQGSPNRKKKGKK